MWENMLPWDEVPPGFSSQHIECHHDPDTIALVFLIVKVVGLPSPEARCVVVSLFGEHLLGSRQAGAEAGAALQLCPLNHVSR